MSLLACTPLFHSVIPEWGFCCVIYTDTDTNVAMFLAPRLIYALDVIHICFNSVENDVILLFV